MGRKRRRKVEPTDEWQELLPLFEWPEQRAYEELRPLALFGGSVAERAGQTGTPERTMYRRVERFEKDGMVSLFATDPAAARSTRRGLEPHIRRMIVELKAQHSKLNDNEISNIVYVRTGRRLGKHTPGRVLSEEVVPLKLSRLFEPYNETEDLREAREAIVTLHLDGWSVKSIASYLKVSRTTVYRVFGRWIEEGHSGLEDRPPGRPRGVRKMDLATMDLIRRAQENPELGAFRIHAALEQKRGAEVSVRTVGTVMAVHRDLYGFGKPKRSSRRKAEMPFEAKRRHEIWTADVRYVPHSIPGVGNAYVIAVLENYSRCVLASAVSLTQDTIAFLRVFYSAVERYGPLERLVTDGGGIFKANQVKAVYRALGIEKEQIERRKPYQSYMRDHVRHPQKDGGLALRKSRDLPRTRGGPRRLEGGLQRAEALGPRKAGGRAAQPARRPRLLHRPPAPPQGGPPPRLLLHPPHACPRCLGVRQVPGLEALRRGGRPPSWQQPDSLTLEYGGQTLSSYDVVELSRETGKPTAVGSARLFGTTYVMRQLRLFALEEAGWHKAMKLEGYAPRRPTGPMALQEVLFPYLDAL